MAYKNNRTKNRRRYKTRYRNAHNYKAKRSQSQTKAAVLVSVVTFVVIASMVVIFTFGDSIYDWLDSKLTAISATPDIVTTAVSEAVTEAPTQAPTAPPETEPLQEAQFIQLAEQNNMKITKSSPQQIIFVDSEGTSCKVYCYERGDDGIYKQIIGPFDGFVGYEGVSDTVGPYEAKTPTGVYKIEYAFGTKEDPGSGLEYTQFTVQSRWITDPNSKNYNRWVEGEEDKDWETSQWLYEYIYSYPYAIVFDYNRSNVDPTKGCAKFLHVSYEPTNGGIGISESDIVSVLYWLNPSKSPCIAISE